MSVFDIKDFGKVMSTAERVQTVYFGFDEDDPSMKTVITHYQEWEMQGGVRRKPLDVSIGDIVEVCMSVADGPYYYSTVIQLGDHKNNNYDFVVQRWHDTIEEAIEDQRAIHGF